MKVWLRPANRSPSDTSPDSPVKRYAFSKVGKKVRGSATGRPIMVVLEMLGRRGALRIFWELRAAPLTFRALQEAAQTHPSLLNSS